MHKHDIKDVDEDLRPKGSFWTSEHVLTACPDLSSPRRGDSFNIFACCMNISSAIQNARGAWMDMRKEGRKEGRKVEAKLGVDISRLEDCHHLL